jgi:hypothetical protein
MGPLRYFAAGLTSEQWVSVRPQKQVRSAAAVGERVA